MSNVAKNKQVELSNGSTINIRPPKVRDLVAVDDIAGEQQKEIHMLSSLTQLTSDEIMGMDIKDYKLLQSTVQDFLD